MEKIAVVTGASSGVGFHASKCLIARGYSVVGIARNSGPLTDVAKVLGAAFIPISADIKNSQAVEAAFAQIGKQFSNIDLLVNNAAIFKMKEFAECSFEDIDQIIDTNLKGTMYCTLAALKKIKSPDGRIINIGSVAGTRGILNQAIYSASKFGLEGFAEALNQEVLKKGITVVSICPGGIDTPLWNATTNPYPGDLGKTIQAHEMGELIADFAEQPPHILLKKVILFPTSEWH